MSWVGQSLQPTAECRAAQPAGGSGEAVHVCALLCVCVCAYVCWGQEGRAEEREGE